MKNIVYLILPLMLLISLQSASRPLPVSPSTPLLIEHPKQGISSNAESVAVKKPGLFQKIAYRILLKKVNKTFKKTKPDEVDANKLAKQSKIMGLLSLAALLLFPMAAIPLGVLAITKGSKALENGTTLTSEAKTGRTLGIISLSLLLASIFIVIIILSGFTFV